MGCPKCGAELLPSEQGCTRCAENPEPPTTTALLESETPDASSRRPFAQITPYSGPYPPAYIQVSSSESRPGPVNILAKWIGLLWSIAIPVCVYVNANQSTAEHFIDADKASEAGVNLYFWIGLWAAVIVPAFLIYAVTRPKSLRNRRAFHPRA